MIMNFMSWAEFTKPSSIEKQVPEKIYLRASYNQHSSAVLMYLVTALELHIFHIPVKAKWFASKLIAMQRQENKSDGLIKLRERSSCQLAILELDLRGLM